MQLRVGQWSQLPPPLLPPPKQIDHLVNDTLGQILPLCFSTLQPVALSCGPREMTLEMVFVSRLQSCLIGCVTDCILGACYMSVAVLGSEDPVVFQRNRVPLGLQVKGGVGFHLEESVPDASESGPVVSKGPL